MKTFFAMMLIAAVSFSVAGCEADMPPAPRRPQLSPVPGQLVQPDRTDDPVIRESTRVGY